MRVSIHTIENSMEIMFTTVPGIEDLVIRELYTLGLTVKKWEKIGISDLCGRVVVDLDIHENYIYLLRKLRTVEKIYLVIERGKFIGKTVEDLDKLIRSINLEKIIEYVTPSTTFAIRSTRAGDHTFTSMDITRIFGECIRNRVYETKKFIPIVDLENPDIVIQFDIIGETYILSIEVTRKSLRYRPYRVYHHEATINPLLAYAMNMLLNYDPDREYVLLDPLCGSGTIIIEGLYYYKKSNYIGIDIDIRNCIGSVRNLIEAKLQNRATILCSDSTRLDKLIKHCDGIVTNPPYGIRMEPLEDIFRFYRKIMSNFVKILDIGNKAVIISPRRNIIEKVLSHIREFRIIERRNVEQGGMISTIFVLEKDREISLL